MSIDNRVTTAVQAPDEVQIRRPSFWQLADDLCCFSETLAMVEAQIAEVSGEDRPLLLAEQAEIQQRIEQLGAELVTKTDSLAGVLRRIPRDVAEYKAERDRYAAKANAAERGLKWLKDYVASTMREHGWKHLKTERNTIALRGNGGVQPLEITDAAAVPGQYCRMEGWIRADVWAEVVEIIGPYFKDSFRPGVLNRLESVPDNGMIREALRMPCPACDGKGFTRMDGSLDNAFDGADTDEKRGCDACHGSGTQQVPGARLLPRGEHLECR